MSGNVFAARIALAALMVAATGTMAGDLVIDLNELDPSPATYWNGSDLSGGFTSGRVFFNNTFTSSTYGDYWSGFTYSRVNDTNTPGYYNQYAVSSGTDRSGNGTYAIGYDSSYDEQDVITLPTPSWVKGFFVNNTTYTALAMQNGEPGAKKFGGASGSDPDWLKLTVTGKSVDGLVLGTADIYLADYRFEDSANDYILTDWTWLNCSAMGPGIRTLHFTLSGSDVGEYGLNTPAYFALDDLILASGPMPAIADFDGLDPEPNLYWNGSDGSGGFRYRGFDFPNTFTPSPYGDYWAGFAYSRVNDTNTASVENQFAVISGSDVSGDGAYGIGYDSSWDNQDIIALPFPATVKGLYVNNTTYVVQDMLNGSQFSKVFGGPTGNDPDWFKLEISGRSESGTTLGTVSFYLADFRSADNTQDYIVTEWRWIDLTPLGAGVRTVHFTLTSSDSAYGYPNTPTYFAMDEISIVPSFSGPGPDTTPWDAGIPGFVGPGGEGLADGPGNSRNPIFGAWATTVIDYSPVTNIAPQFADPLRILGPATGNHFDTASLGDLDDTQLQSGVQPGEVTLGFPLLLENGSGADFAVFENGLSESSTGRVFGELGYVEVSSDGIHFARFPSVSLNTNDIGAYAPLDARNVYNLCGKHANASGMSWGTPFDLSDLIYEEEVQNGSVNLAAIRYVKVVDIPGNGDFYDSSSPSNAILDPWLTSTEDFPSSGGVDLEAVGVINSPELVHVTVEATPHGLVTPYGVPGNRVTLHHGSNVTFTITPDPDFHIAHVMVDGLSLGNTNEVSLTAVTNDRVISVTFGHRLTVISPHGTAHPPHGEHYGFGPTTLTMTTPIVTAGGTQTVCTGWAGTGSLTSGVGSVTGPFDLTNDTTISWLWDTNYALTVAATRGGQVDHDGGWYRAGGLATSTATSDPYFSFVGWSGQTAGDTNLAAMNVVMDGARHLVANFYAPMTTNGTPLGWLEHYRLTNGTPDEVDSVDGDLDGEDTWQEFLAGTDPTDRDSRFAIINQGCVDGTNFVTWLGGTNGSALPFSVYATGTLTGQWTLVDGTVVRAPSGTNTWWHDCTNGVSYYRVVVEP